MRDGLVNRIPQHHKCIFARFTGWVSQLFGSLSMVGNRPGTNAARRTFKAMSSIFPLFRRRAGFKPLNIDTCLAPEQTQQLAFK